MTLKFDKTKLENGWIKGLPCDGIITTFYGIKDSLHPKGHAGVDIAVPGDIPGTYILCPADGVVADVFDNNKRGTEWDGFKDIFGNWVIIDHGDYYSSYGHLRDMSPLVEGQPIKQGDFIGYMGSTGFSTAPHLHWAVAEKNNRYFNFPADGPVGVLFDPLSFIVSENIPDNLKTVLIDRIINDAESLRNL